MNLSPNTLAVLKNFSTINGSILFRRGNVIRTVSNGKTIMAKAEVEDSFDREFAIYDLPQFLGVLSVFNAPEIKTGESELTILDDKRRAVFVYADKSTFMVAKETDINFPDPEVEFDLSAKDLISIQKAGSLLQLPEIAFIGNGESFTVEAIDSKNPTGNSFKLQLGETDKTFKTIIKSENLKMINNDYYVEISSKGIAKFSSPRLTYWVAVDKSSTFS